MVELKNFLGEYLHKLGFVLVELISRYEGKNTVLKILVDKPEGGISIGDCAYLNEQLSRLLDERDLIPESYLLEVSSPGLDRPLRTRSDFLRCLNRKVRFWFTQAQEGKREWEGIIKEVKGDSLIVYRENALVEIPLAKISRAKQMIEE